MTAPTPQDPSSTPSADPGPSAASNQGVVSDAPGADGVAAQPAVAATNGAARAAGVLATTAVAGLGCIAAFGLLNLAFFATVAAAAGVGAIVLGHVGRARGRRTGTGRGTSLAAIVVGWLAVAAVGVLVLLWFTLMAGLHALTS